DRRQVARRQPDGSDPSGAVLSRARCAGRSTRRSGRGHRSRPRRFDRQGPGEATGEEAVSLHPPPVPSPAEVLAASSRPIPARIRTTSLVLAIIGAIVFMVGLFVNPDRVWTAFHFNW